MYKLNSPNKRTSDSLVLRFLVIPSALQAVKILFFFVLRFMQLFT